MSVSPPEDVEFVFHIAQADWGDVSDGGMYAPASLSTEGFIHCSTAEQVVDTALRHYAGASDLLLLEIRVSVVADELRWEPAPAAHPNAGDLYPHLYGPLPMSAIARVRPLDV